MEIEMTNKSNEFKLISFCNVSGTTKNVKYKKEKHFINRMYTTHTYFY